MNAEVQTSVNTREKDYTWRGPVLSKSIIANILSTIDIVDIIRDELWKEWRKFSSKKNKVGFLCLCPFHREYSPSFRVNRNMQIYKCFACWAHGNVIKFLMEYRWWKFVQSVIFLAKKAWIPIRYGRFYKEDYLSQYDNYTNWIFDSLEGIEYSQWLQDSEVDDYEKQYRIERVNRLKSAVAVILWERERRYGELFWKTQSEVLWQDLYTEHDALLELMEFTNVFDEEQFIADAEREKERERVELEERLELERHQRVTDLKNCIRWRVHQLQEQRRERERMQEQEKIINAFYQRQQVNLSKLNEQLSSRNQDMQAFFDRVDYGTIMRWGSLAPGSMGKFVCIYSEAEGFSCVLWEKRFLIEIPDHLEELSYVLETGRMANSDIFHKWINIWKNGAMRFWWAQFLFLNGNTVIVSGQSNDFWPIPHDIVSSCFENIGYSVLFLDDSPTVKKSHVYSQILKK